MRDVNVGAARGGGHTFVATAPPRVRGPPPATKSLAEYLPDAQTAQEYGWPFTKPRDKGLVVRGPWQARRLGWNGILALSVEGACRGQVDAVSNIVM